MKKKIPTSIRSVVFRRDNYRCRGCGLADSRHLEADHVIPESLGGPTTPDNLVTLCGACNRVKGATIIPELPILPPVEGFGDHVEILARFEKFVKMVERCRETMVEDAANTVRQWKNEGMTASQIRERIPSLAGSRNVSKVIFLAFKDNIQAYREMTPQ